MYFLKDIIEKCKEKNVKFFEVGIPSETLTCGVRFYEIDKFFDFLNINKINTAFGIEIYESEEDYIITEEIIEEILGRYVSEETIDCIEKDIDEYNNKISEFDFDAPSTVIVACLFEGHFFFIDLHNKLILDEDELEEPSYVLEQIVIRNEEKIREEKEKRDELIEKLKEDLKEYILKDKEFFLCTNQHLRYSYTQNLFSKKLGKKYDVLKKYWMSSPGVVCSGAVDYVEMLWRQYGKGK